MTFHANTPGDLRDAIVAWLEEEANRHKAAAKLLNDSGAERGLVHAARHRTKGALYEADQLRAATIEPKATKEAP